MGHRPNESATLTRRALSLVLLCASVGAASACAEEGTYHQEWSEFSSAKLRQHAELSEPAMNWGVDLVATASGEAFLTAELYSDAAVEGQLAVAKVSREGELDWAVTPRPFRWPQIGVAANGDVMVADVEDDRVEIHDDPSVFVFVFDEDGELVRSHATGSSFAAFEVAPDGSFITAPPFSRDPEDGPSTIDVYHPDLSSRARFDPWAGGYAEIRKLEISASGDLAVVVRDEARQRVGVRRFDLEGRALGDTVWSESQEFDRELLVDFAFEPDGSVLALGERRDEDGYRLVRFGDDEVETVGTYPTVPEYRPERLCVDGRGYVAVLGRRSVDLEATPDRADAHDQFVRLDVHEPGGSPAWNDELGGQGADATLLHCGDPEGPTVAGERVRESGVSQLFLSRFRW